MRRIIQKSSYIQRWKAIEMVWYRKISFKGSFPAIYADRNYDDDNAVMYITSIGIYRDVDLSKFKYSSCLLSGWDGFNGEGWGLIFVPFASRNFIEEYFAHQHDDKHASRDMIAKDLMKPILFEYKRRKQTISNEVFQKYRPAEYAQPGHYIILDGLVGRYPDTPLPSKTVNGFILFDVDVPLLD